MTISTKRIKTDDHEVERHWPQILAILIGSLSGFTEGLLYSWTSPFIPQILKDTESYSISEEQASYLNTFTPVAMLIGCPIFSILTDRIGRKRTFLLIAFTQMLSWILAAVATNVYVFYASRFCAGLSNACFFGAFPIYIGEIANPTVRGSWGNASASSMYLGEFLINVLGYFFDLRVTSYICLIFPILFLVFFSCMPESPYYYVMKGRENDAKDALRFLTRKRNVEKEYLQMKSDTERQLSESASWSDLFRIESNRKAIIAGSFLRFSQQTSGLGIFLILTQLIFQKSGSNISDTLSTMLYVGLNVVLNLIVSFFIVHRFQRRTLYIASLTGSALILYILGTYFYLGDRMSSFNWVPITGMMIYLSFTSFGICVIPTLMMSELYSASIKAKAMTILSILMSVGNIVVNTSYFYLSEYIGFYAPFYVYAVCNTISVVLSYYFIPETKGKTLEQIQQMLKKKMSLSR